MWRIAESIDKYVPKSLLSTWGCSYSLIRPSWFPLTRLKDGYIPLPRAHLTHDRPCNWLQRVFIVFSRGPQSETTFQPFAFKAKKFKSKMRRFMSACHDLVSRPSSAPCLGNPEHRLGDQAIQGSLEATLSALSWSSCSAMKTSAAAAEMKAVAACGPRDSAPWGRPQEGVQKKKGLFGNPFRRLSSNASEPKEPFEFHLVRNGKAEDLKIVDVGGLKDIGELTEAVIDAGKDPKWTMFTVKVFGSEEDAKAGTNAVRRGV